MNVDAVRQVVEPGLAGVTIFLDANNNGELDDGEVSTGTAGDGSFRFTDVGPGTFLVRERVPTGWVQTTPDPAPIVTTSGNDVGGVNFGNAVLNGISGVKFNDLNGDGIRQAGEPGLGGFTIFLDSNDNGVRDGTERAAVTDSSGRYSFLNLATGFYRVREVRQAGMLQTTPLTALNLFFEAGSDVTDVNVGNFRLVTISGVKFNDLNGDGIRQAGEPGLAGVTIFVDNNANGVLDFGEVTQVTTATGSFSFSLVGPGTFLIREVVPTGFVQTTVNPAPIVTSSGTNVTTVTFGNFRVGTAGIRGTTFHDLNGDGTRQENEPGLADVTLFLDANNNGQLDPGETSTVSAADGAFSFTDLVPGTYRVREVVPAGWTQTTPNPADIVVTTGMVATGVVFGNFRLISLSGTKFHDLNGDGVRQAGELGLAGVTLFLDANNNGRLDPGETSLVTTANNFYSFTNLGPGTYRIREVVPPGSVQTTANLADIVAVSGRDVSGLDIGNLRLGGGVAGRDGRTIAFWASSQGLAILADGGTAAPELALLQTFNLRNADGSHFDPTSTAQLQAWLLSATGPNVAHALSVQLAAMVLSVEAGFVSGSALLFAPGTNSANALGLTTVDALIAEVNAELGLHGTALPTDVWWTYQRTLRDILEAANSNLIFLF
jgi:hypothetical protein